MKELKYFYKTADSKCWLGDCVEHKEKGLVAISKAEWDAHIASIQSKGLTAEELELREKRKQIAQAKQYLASTDWVIVKIAESTDESEIAELRQKYADIITERKAKRQLINELEK